MKHLAPPSSVPFGLDKLSNQERFEMDVYQAFLNGLKGFWRDDVYSRVKAEAEQLGDLSAEEYERHMAGRESYFLYSWLERRMQQFKFSGRWGLETLASKHRHEFDELLPAPPDAADAADRVPYYVKEPDVHQLPGGLWGGCANAVAHEWYQNGATFSGVPSDSQLKYFSETVASLASGRNAMRILDQGCALGRSTLVIKEAVPDAYVEGIDVCEPVLRLAKYKAQRNNIDVVFREASVDELPYGDSSFDIVASRWLFHELPKPVIAKALDEVARVMRPGGSLVILDMYHIPGGQLGLWLHEGFGIRNNEPYAAGFAGLDLEGLLAERGFVGFKAIDFEPSTARAEWVEELPAKRTHYFTMVVATKRGASRNKSAVEGHSQR